jgi:hypothetical protein
LGRRRPSRTPGRGGPGQLLRTRAALRRSAALVPRRLRQRAFLGRRSERREALLVLVKPRGEHDQQQHRGQCKRTAERATPSPGPIRTSSASGAGAPDRPAGR